jgi:predicted PhzF superfamily epimerase YddE/YHI9
VAALFPDGGAPSIEAWRGGEDVLAVVPAAADVVGLDPDADALAGIAARAVLVSGPGEAGSPIDVVSRVFCPSAGVVEDQVTGSAHCLIGPYWSARLGRPRLRARQASPRGGELIVDVRGDRVGVAGPAVTVMRGKLASGGRT